MELRRAVLAGLAIGTLTVGIAAAQSANRTIGPDSGFMTKGTQEGLAEIELGKLAVQHAAVAHRAGCLLLSGRARWHPCVQ